MRLLIVFLAGATAIVIVMFGLGCGNKQPLPTDLPPLEFPTTTDSDYIQINPVWTEADGIPFDRPFDIHIGYDRFIYICDTGNNRIVKLNVDGTFIESYAIKNPVAVTQDRGLDLIAVAGDYSEIEVIDSNTIDTTTYGNAIYRRRYLVGGDFEEVWRAPFLWEVRISPFGDTRWVKPEFWGIESSTDIDKEYYVADFLGDRIYSFTPNDSLISYEGLLGPGEGIGQTTMPDDIYSYEIAGQRYLAVAQANPSFGVQIYSMPDVIPIFSDTTEFSDLIRFMAARHKDVVVDDRSNFFLLIENTDPWTGANKLIYEFNRYGEEVRRFATYGNGELQFNKPQGIAWAHGTLFIADTFNNRIIRLRLATDVQI